jgi:hypothetical protein
MMADHHAALRIFLQSIFRAAGEFSMRRLPQPAILTPAPNGLRGDEHSGLGGFL